ncbi:HGT3 [Candida pseudojiufengensis]|uniref:HGT3 n=1 Tax=Candida pseudojiufengensis TaxID=497109 RepID=UPI0022256F64|nr:HGT3 [Candida pseudojiufengensis]KAI5961374.1 HGT3 [Candida pseudojiufengensis]
MAATPANQQQNGHPQNDDHKHIQIKDSFLVGKALLNFTSIFVSLGVFLFGFEQGLMSSLITNEFFKSYYHEPKPAAIGIMISILEIGALFSSFIAGRVGDLVGRKKTIRYGSFIFVIGALIQFLSPTIFILSCGRLIGGVAIGFLTTIVPIYQSEISPPTDRGFYACAEFTGNIIGYAASIWVDYGFSFFESNTSWKSPLFVQFMMGVFLWLGTYIIVETPRWLLNHDHDLEGMVVIADMYADGDVEDEHAKNEYRNIKEGVLIDRIEGGERSYQYLFKRYAKRLSVACFGLFFSQMNGINLISYYAPMIFESAGWVGRQAIFMTGINSIIYVLSTIPPWYLVDSWGRKPLLMVGALFMGIPLYIAGYSLYLDDKYTAAVVVTSIIIANAAFGFSWGGIGWLLPSEILPLPVRSKGAALATATNWLSNFIVGLASPILLDEIKWKTYLIPATSCIISFFAVWYLFPETKGLSLEEMGSVFDDKSSIFSYHASGNVGSNSSSANSLNNYGSTTERRPSQSVNEPETVQTAAMMARNPATMRPELDNLIVGGSTSNIIPAASTSSLKPVKSDAGSIASFDMNNVDVVQEIEPPTLKQILDYKLREQNKPSFISELFNKNEKKKNNDEENRLLE